MLQKKTNVILAGIYAVVLIFGNKIVNNVQDVATIALHAQVLHTLKLKFIIY